MTCLLSSDLQIKRVGQTGIHLLTKRRELRWGFSSREETTLWIEKLQDRCEPLSRKKETIKQKGRLARLQQGINCLKTSAAAAKLVRLWVSPGGEKLYWQAKGASTKQIALALVRDMRLTSCSRQVALVLDLGGRKKEFIVPDAALVTWFTGLQGLGLNTAQSLSSGQCLIRKAMLRLRCTCSDSQRFSSHLIALLFSKPKKRFELPRMSVGNPSTACSSAEPSATSRSSNGLELELSDCDLTDQEEAIPEPKVSPSWRTFNLKHATSPRAPRQSASQLPLCETQSLMGSLSARSPTRCEPEQTQLLDLVSSLLFQNSMQKTQMERIERENKRLRTNMQATILKQKTFEVREALASLREEVSAQYAEFTEVWPHVMQLTTQHIRKTTSE